MSDSQRLHLASTPDDGAAPVAVPVAVPVAGIWPASHDALTGLPNRSLMRERIASALQRARRSDTGVAVLFIDLDGFRQVNDMFGHDAGDLLLRTVTRRLPEQVRAGESVARLAGDEFVILCEAIDDPAAMGILAERIVEALRVPVDYHGTPLFVTASVGVAIGDGALHCADDLLRYADAAMSAAKKKGGDGWQFFSEQVHAQATRRLSLGAGLRTALASQELSPRFQPIVAADSGRIVGAELLLRWHPPTGEVSPAEFIPIAETGGTIVAIGAWVFRQACRAEADWRQRWGAAAPYVSVNLSPRQLDDPGLVDEFVAAMAESGADPARLLLEITETALMTDVETNLRVLRQLADLGLRVAVDDFGTGYSSLAQLTRLPVDVLKIDRAFIDGIDKSPESRTVIRAVIGLGRSLGLKLVAEGVETAAQQMELSAFGCDFIQGYHFHRPLTEDVFVSTVERERDALASGAVSPGVAAPLHFLIYVSQASEAVTADELAGLLAQARGLNRAAGVTGCLVYQDGYFMQMLEGRSDVIFAVLEKIRRNPRHRNLQLVIEGPARRRIFADWSMVLRDLTPGPDEPDFGPWQQRSIGFAELAADARTCYAYITGYVPSGLAR